MRRSHQMASIFCFGRTDVTADCSHVVARALHTLCEPGVSCRGSADVTADCSHVVTWGCRSYTKQASAESEEQTSLQIAVTSCHGHAGGCTKRVSSAFEEATSLQIAVTSWRGPCTRCASQGSPVAEAQTSLQIAVTSWHGHTTTNLCNSGQCYAHTTDRPLHDMVAVPDRI